MPINVATGSTVEFTVTFFDTANVITVPTSATMTVTYPPSSNSLTLVSCSFGLTPVGSFFVGTWATSVAALGNSSYAASAPGQASPTTGTLRITS